MIEEDLWYVVEVGTKYIDSAYTSEDLANLVCDKLNDNPDKDFIVESCTLYRL